MQISKTDPSRYNSNCISLKEKLILQQSVHRPCFDYQVLRLRPLENFLCSGQPTTLVITDIKTGNVPLKNSLWMKRFFIRLSKHCGYWPGRFQ